MRTLAVLICLVVTLALPVCADRYELSVPGVTGNYQDSSLKAGSFDFGQSFSEIYMVELYMSGYLLCGWSQDPYYSTRFLGGTFYIDIADADGTPGMYASRDYQADQQSSLYFNDMLMVNGMPDSLLSGKGSVAVSFFTETDPNTRHLSSADIYDFNIIVDGTAAPTPVPEPSTIVAGIACLTPFILRRRK